MVKNKQYVISTFVSAAGLRCTVEPCLVYTYTYIAQLQENNTKSTSRGTLSACMWQTLYIEEHVHLVIIVCIFNHLKKDKF